VGGTELNATNESDLQLLKTSIETNPVTQGSNVSTYRISALLTKAQPTIYDSTLLNKKFKPNPNDLTLDPDIEPLNPLILSQHEAFNQTIQELGITSIMLTKIIEKKKESCQQIKDYGKIPRSLRLKCVLTTSPSYIENPDFLRLKEKLQEKTDTYNKEGTDIMAEWAAINIKLLSTDRCHDILSKVLQILDGLISYSAEIIGVPNWPSAPNNNLTPLLFKFYLSGRIFDISNIANYLELTSEIILEIGIKILTKESSKVKLKEMIDSLNLNDIDMNDNLHNIFVKETLLNFDQIIRFTTIYVWEHHKNLVRQDTAGNNLKIKMKSAATTTATEATAFAIAKATSNIQKEQDLSLSASLRLSKLKKSLKRQEQKTNEVYNNAKRSKNQKNKDGSQLLESLTSPPPSTPTHYKTQAKARHKQKVVDLTKDASEDLKDNSFQHNKKERAKRTRKDRTAKAVKWKREEITKYNPEAPASATTENSSQKITNQTQAPVTGVFNLPQLPSLSFPYAHPNPYLFTLASLFGQPLAHPFHLNAQTNQLHFPQSQTLNPHSQQQHQQTSLTKNNPFYSPF
jgi:hypothetical protein